MLSDTIAAVATGYSSAGISVIRISGLKALEIADRIFLPEDKTALIDSKGYRAHFGSIVYKGEILDEGIALVMRMPHSYTGEDTVEISCHGGPLVTKRVLEAVIGSGAMPAEPGEFTKRAFLNGKLDLAEAEAVAELIASKNEHARKESVSQLKGRLSEKICKIRNDLLDDAAYIEAALDDPEHIELDGFSAGLKERLIPVKELLFGLIKDFDTGRQLKEGIKTVILGKPNAGKSSLINLFTGHDMAIVTEIAGTTRDILTEQVSFNGISFEMTDTAGIRDTKDIVEKIGVERSIESAENADLILYVVDSSTPLGDEDKKVLEIVRNRKVIVVYNKTDLDPKTSLNDIKKLVGDAPVIPFSAKDGADIHILTDKMTEMFVSGIISSSDQVIITNLRHKKEVETAIEAIDAVIKGIDEGFSEDLLAIDLNEAISALGRILGISVDDDIINRVFEKFCMGK